MRVYCLPSVLLPTLLPVFLKGAILIKVRWNLAVLLIDVSLMAKDVEHVFISCFYFREDSKQFASPFMGWIVYYFDFFFLVLYIF